MKLGGGRWFTVMKPREESRKLRERSGAIEGKTRLLGGVMRRTPDAIILILDEALSRN